MNKAGFSKLFLYVALMAFALSLLISYLFLERPKLAVIDTVSVAKIYLMRHEGGQGVLESCLRKNIEAYAKDNKVVILPKAAVIAGDVSDVSLHVLKMMEKNCA